MAAMRLATEADDALSVDVRRQLIQGTYLRANALTVVSCAVKALLADWDRMDDDTRRNFLEMAQERAADLVGVLKRDVAVLEISL